MVRIVAELAPAKINLCLHVTGKRPDGYHNLDSIMLPVTLCDRIAIELRDGRERRVTLHCDRTDIPLDEGNLAVRAAHAFMDEFNLNADVTIDLRKAIPAGAGLGGGSSDAAAVLRAMAALTRRGDPSRLASLALRLGADVPFFLLAVPARARGVGEILNELPGFPRLDLVIAAPAVEVSTAAVFRTLTAENWSGPITDSELERMTSGRLAGAKLINDLEPAATALCPIIGELKLKLQLCGALSTGMSGSGGTVFGIFGDAPEALKAAAKVRSEVANAVVHAVHTSTTDSAA
jgi:4-diphosphocytidyl-2-C-methyl-D-erythritol kinase